MSPTTAPTVHPVILLILDGFGYREPAADNAISLARKPTGMPCGATARTA